MASKKSSPFMTFVFEWKKAPQNRRLSLKHAVKEAGEVWKEMTVQEKDKYKSNASRAGRIPKKREQKERLDCYGRPISETDRELEDAERKERLMKNTIGIKVHTSAKNGELDTASYIFISVNYFHHSPDTNDYVPAEISLCEFSLKEGVSRIHHVFVNPNFNMYGFHYTAKEHSESTHQLPLPPDAKGERNMENVYKGILDFIRKDDGTYSPIYTTEQAMPVVESVLAFLGMHSTREDDYINVFSIQYLLFVMKDETTQLGELESERPSSQFITNEYFDKDPFEFEMNIACDYHESIDRCRYCTKSFVTRWGYMFADLMCNDIAIPLIPGRHCPKRTVVQDFSVAVKAEETLNLE